jgi:hypothetical protein
MRLGAGRTRRKLVHAKEYLKDWHAAPDFSRMFPEHQGHAQTVIGLAALEELASGN